MLALAAVFACSEPTDPRATPAVWASIDAGAAVTCAVSADGRGYCWGEAWSIGQTTTPDAPITAPREVAGSRRWLTIEAGTQIACGLTVGGATYCWGPALWPDTVPTSLPADPGFASITAGDAHACGLTQDGTGYCWGDNFRGQTGAGPAWSLTSPLRSATPVAGGLKFLALRAGPESTCGLVMNGDLYCWGGSEVGGEGIEPRLVQQGFAFATLAYGGNIGGRGHVCAPVTGGRLYCFRYEPHELLAQPTPTEVVLPDPAPLHDLEVGGVWTPLVDLPYSYQLHACAVGAVGTVSCWGSNAYGQLGDGTDVDRAMPATVSQLGEVIRVATGGVHSCAITSSGVAYCWGANNRGQLGIGNSGGTEPRPREVAPPQP